MSSLDSTECISSVPDREDVWVRRLGFRGGRSGIADGRIGGLYEGELHAPEDSSLSSSWHDRLWIHYSK